MGERYKLFYSSENSLQKSLLSRRVTGNILCSSAARKLMLGLLNAEPQQRLTFCQVIDHPFCRGVPPMAPVPPMKPQVFRAVRLTTHGERLARSASVRNVRRARHGPTASSSMSNPTQYGRDEEHVEMTNVSASGRRRSEVDPPFLGSLREAQEHMRQPEFQNVPGRAPNHSDCCGCFSCKDKKCNIL